MATRASCATVFLVILAGCTTAAREPKLPPDGLLWSPETPFRKQPKVEIPGEAAAINYFLRGQVLLGEGNFDGALKEFESAAQANPDDAFLRFRLASLYLRKGDLKKAVVEAEAAVRLDPKNVDSHLLLAGLYSSLGDNQKGLAEYNEVL
jgi:tetratricopeptide (TPR) repeat protein